MANRNKNCVCGNFFCISGNPKYICKDCHKNMCNMLKIFDRIDNKERCIICYAKSFSDSLNTKKESNFFIVNDKQENKSLY